MSSSNFLGVVFFWNLGFHLLIFIFLWSSTSTELISTLDFTVVIVVGDVDFTVVIVVGDVDFTVVIVVDFSVFDFIMFTVVIVDNTVGSVIDGNVVIVVGDVNGIVGIVIDFIVVIVVGDCKVVTVVFLLSFLLL